VVDGEIAGYQEMDGHYNWLFGLIWQVIRIELIQMKNGSIELNGKNKDMPKLREKFEENLKELSDRLLQTFPNFEKYEGNLISIAINIANLPDSSHPIPWH
jgi:hypothetical protein